MRAPIQTIRCCSSPWSKNSRSPGSAWLISRAMKRLLCCTSASAVTKWPTWPPVCTQRLRRAAWDALNSSSGGRRRSLAMPFACSHFASCTVSASLTAKRTRPAQSRCVQRGDGPRSICALTMRNIQAWKARLCACDSCTCGSAATRRAQAGIATVTAQAASDRKAARRPCHSVIARPPAIPAFPMTCRWPAAA